MAVPVGADAAVDEFRDLLRTSRWGEAIELYERGPAETRKAREFKLPYAIALIRSGRELAGIKLLAECLSLPNARDEIRRYVVSYLMNSGRFEHAATVLQLLVDADPNSVEDLRSGASVLGRLKRRDEALEMAAHLIALRPDDLPGHNAYLQLLLQTGRNEEAGAHAEALGDKALGHGKLSSMALLALTRSGRIDAAVEIASSLDESQITDDAVAGAIVRTYLDAGRVDAAISAGDTLLVCGLDHATLRSALGQAWLASQRDNRYEKAIEHFREGLELAPKDWRMRAAIGEALLRNRQYEQAIPHLEESVRARPDAGQQRALLARALKQAGRFDEAAVEFRKLIDSQPSTSRWQRYAAGALSQAGDSKEAAKLFDAFVAKRRTSLPKDFGKGLNALWDRVDEAQIPQARLDWAWKLRSPDLAMDRAEWERRARWGHLADHYLLDWLECRDDRVHDAMQRLADLSQAESVLSATDLAKGAILASAHIGPMYAGPLALELLGVRSRWLASTPGVARTAYSRSLISTSDQDDMQVAKSFMESVRAGFSVVIAIDGAINLAAPRIPFEGQEMTYSSFAARTAHKLGVPSLFCAPRWVGERIGFVLERMPDPNADEDADSHAARWRDAFLGALRDYLSGAPENLRLSGGLWRHIR